MRADRLVAALLFLQTRGRVTAAEVAAELEVSERTARRDLEALATAGIPVYAQAGRGGGWALVGGARTDLSGLTESEIRALFLLAGPSATSPELRVVLRKLVRALPAPLREGAEAASRAGVDDGTDWSGTEAGEPRLPALQRAVVEGHRLRIGYARPGEEPRERTVHPLGVAAKAGVRYLVADTDAGLRTFRVSRIVSVVETGEPAVRPAEFDLATTWRRLAARMEDRMVAATVRGRAAPGTEAVLDRLLGGRLRYTGRDEDGWSAIEVDGPTPEVVAAQLAGLGARVEVLEPPEARAHLARLGAELALVYADSTPSAPPGANRSGPA
ncbi:helix-turn-helix transcriptional regulator [Streptomyces sp. NPDC048338]|uniref:helix-turn-helix transcriptional regulator n=1 Tax=Streptomyces sp. NPDC048338 TaxID=3365536 RepID=UPI00371FA6F3